MLAERLSAQMLSGKPARDPVAVADRLLAVQAQDLRAARLAIRARSTGLTASEIDRVLTEDRSILVAWLNRGTLHLVRSEDYGWLHALTAPTMVQANARRLDQEGVTPSEAERGVAAIERALAEEGPLTRAQLRERVDAVGVPTKGQALVHIMWLASLRGLIVRGPVIGKEQAHVLVRDWLGEPKPVDRDTALAELSRRFLAGHGPAEDRDLAKWAGLPLRDVRAGLSAIAPELRDHGGGLVDLAKRSAVEELPPPRLLGAWEPVLMGWRSREPILGTPTELVTINGIFRPFAMVQGRAAGTWSLAGGKVSIQSFSRLSATTKAELQRDAEDVVRFMT